MIEIIVLRTVRVMAARVEQLVDQRAVRRHDDLVTPAIPALVFVLRAEIIGVKHARIALAPQQDQGVGQRFEPGFDPVSYTHLDVYKRQVQDTELMMAGSVLTVLPVSYTHLDVYKRQLLRKAPSNHVQYPKHLFAARP